MYLHVGKTGIIVRCMAVLTLGLFNKHAPSPEMEFSFIKGIAMCKHFFFFFAYHCDVMFVNYFTELAYT